jgi:hypothetical protein
VVSKDRFGPFRDRPTTTITRNGDTLPLQLGDEQFSRVTGHALFRITALGADVDPVATVRIGSAQIRHQGQERRLGLTGTDPSPLFHQGYSIEVDRERPNRRIVRVVAMRLSGDLMLEGKG